MFFLSAKNNIVLINFDFTRGSRGILPQENFSFLTAIRLFLVASETCLFSDIYWFPSLLIQYVSSRAECEAENKLC